MGTKLVSRSIAATPLLLAAVCSLAAAQPKAAMSVNQTSNGPNSPTVYAPNGQVWINYVDINKLVGTFADKGDKVSREIAAKLRAGEFEAAEQLISKALAERQAREAELAFLHSAQGTVEQSQRQLVRAEKAFALATALAPNNCEYRGRWGLALKTVGRLDKLGEIVGPDTPEATACLKRASAVDRSRILLAQTTLNALERRKDAAYDKLDQLEVLFEGVLDGPEKVTWEAAVLGCRVGSATAELRRPEDPVRIERLRKVCQALAIRAAASHPLARLVSGDEPVGATRTERIEALRSQIALARTAPRIGELGLDRIGKEVYLGRLASELGFLILWSNQPDLAEVRQLYGEAFKLLQPHAAADNPEALVNFSQLIFRVAHFDEMHEGLALKIDLARTLGDLARRVAMRPYDRVPFACHGLNRLDAAIRLRIKVVPPADAALVTKERDRCLDAVAKTAPTYLDELRRYANSNDAYVLKDQGKTADALLLADKVVESAMAARGFPYYLEESYRLLEAVELRTALQFDLKQFPQALRDSELQLSIARQQKQARNELIALQNIYASRQGADPEDREGIFEAGRAWLRAANQYVVAEARDDANGTASCSSMSDFLLAAQAGIGSAFAAGRSVEIANAVGLVLGEKGRASNCRGFHEAPGEKRDVNQFIRGRIALALFDVDFAAAVLAPPLAGQPAQFADGAVMREAARLEQLGLKLPLKDLPVSTQLYETWQDMRQANRTGDTAAVSKP